MTALSPRRTFSGTALKTIACITMLVDHIGASCIEAGILTPGLDAGTLSQDILSAYPLYRLDMVLRFTGRLAFPLFCFLLVEGFVHTHNVKGYLGRLVLFGLLSEVPFDLAFFRTPFDPSAQNVYWTLALGVLAMALLQKSEDADGNAAWTGRLAALACAVVAQLPIPTTTPSACSSSARCTSPAQTASGSALWARCCSCSSSPPRWPLCWSGSITDSAARAVRCKKRPFTGSTRCTCWCWQVSRTCCFEFTVK